MLAFIVRRLMLLVPMLLGVSMVIFFVLRLSGADPAMSYLRSANIPPTDQAIAQAEKDLGLDKPLPEQYVVWLTDVVQLDFGVSYMTRRPVLDEILYYLPATLQLASLALLLTLGISIPLGMWAARQRDKWPDFTVRGLAFLGVSIPNFWLGFMLVLLFSVQLQWLPPMGYGDLEYMILPAFAIAFMSLCINARLLRTSMLEAQGQRYVLYARMRGVSERRVENAHVLRNGLIPVVTAAGMHIGELIGGSLVVESIFGWPGVGRYAISAISNNDYPIIQCFTLLMTVIFVVCNLIIDILYAWLDPRVRLGSEASA
ncbi:nickel ABC transporter permease subunit NikB [Oceanospirillum sediminis]|uniref:Nickel ABC transporter permease subunit NikB n=1 Tax=Oceanospirillum sediminis TaxID=2760088 RepID=A0A839IMC8_9GAMM|nr:nickel ABC transporter permease subunit NikB [Oceanospirillum sediminis]MBB1486108.1 nickel ABC transporter permease subunit NikB [Oceanospirillum sediminis]